MRQVSVTSMRFPRYHEVSSFRHCGPTSFQMVLYPGHLSERGNGPSSSVPAISLEFSASKVAAHSAGYLGMGPKALESCEAFGPRVPDLSSLNSQPRRSSSSGYISLMPWMAS
jgi:hypothetical protein